MRIIIITQDEPFYLKENLSYLFKLLPDDVKIVGCIISDVSPFGKKESFYKKALKTFKIFGHKFFIYYSLKYIYSKLFKFSVKRFILSKQIPEIILKESINSNNSIDLISTFKPDLLVSILGNQIFKKPLINLAPKGCINLHTALLPKYRGLMPTFWVLKNNEKYTGASVFFVDEGIDSGPIIVQKKFLIGNKSQAELIRYSKKIGMELIASAIKKINQNNFSLIENNNSEKTYFSFPTKKDVREFIRIGKRFF